MTNIELNKFNAIYLDTSFILYALYYCINHKKQTIKKSENILWDLFAFEQGKCYISNITLSEVYTVVEKTALQEFNDNKIIKEENITIDEWKNYNPYTRNQLRTRYSSITWFNIKLKDWRIDESNKDYYKAKVIDSIQNIIDSLPEYVCISWFKDNTIVCNNFKKIKKLYNQLDWNDINHYLLCKDNNIDCIISCDSDFEWINDKELMIYII